VKIYNLLLKEDDKKFLLAIQRFNSLVDTHSNIRNSFIDCITILESLFLDNATDELRFRFSLIISFILNNKLKIKVNLNKVKKFYDIRSILVHSGYSKDFKNETFYECLHYTRELLKWYLLNKKNRNDNFKKIIQLLKINS